MLSTIGGKIDRRNVITIATHMFIITINADESSLANISRRPRQGSAFSSSNPAIHTLREGKKGAPAMPRGEAEVL